MPRRPSPASSSTTPTQRVLRARFHMVGLFALLGFTVGSWLARLPSVREQLDLSSGALGTVFLAGAIGGLSTVLVSGAITTRLGSRRVLMGSAWLFSVASVLLGLGPWLGSVPVLTLGVILMSISFAVGNVPLNVQTVVIERAMGRTVVPQFHAGFSLGSVTGSLLGAGAAWIHLPLLAQFGAVAVGSLAWRLVTIPRAVLPEEPAPGAQDAAPARRGGGWREALRAWRDPRTVVLGLVVMTGALSEGTANNWLAVGVVDAFAAREAVGAAVFSAFVASMTVARFAGTWVIERFGRTPVLVTSAVVSTTGLVCWSLAPTLAVVVVGAVAWGLGAGLIGPIAMAAVTGVGPGAAGRVVVVSTMSNVANLVAPPLVGLAAEVVGVQHAVLGTAAVMVVGIALSRRALGDPADLRMTWRRPVPEPAGLSGRARIGHAVRVLPRALPVRRSAVVPTARRRRGVAA